MLHLFPNGGATDIVFVTVLRDIAVGRGAEVAAQCRTAGTALTDILSVFLAAVHGSVGLPGWRLFGGFTLLSPFSHSSP